MKKLTNRQADILRFVIKYIKDYSYPPTLREIGVQFEIGSTNGVNDHLRALERKGYIIRDIGLSRSIAVLCGPDKEKLRPDLLDPEFLLALDAHMQAGIKDGRVKDDWKIRDSGGVQDRFEAIDRHLEKYDSTLDPKHFLAIASNAMIVWWHKTQKEKV